MRNTILFPLFLATALLFSACVKRAQSGETHVGRGELYRTGNVAFDEFFEDVNSLQKEAKTIKDAETAAMARIGKLMSLSDPKASTVFVAVKERARLLAESKKNKAWLKLEGIDDHGRPQPGKPITVTATGLRGQAAHKDAQEFAAALDEASKAEGQLAERFFPLAEKAKRRISEADRMRASVEMEFSSSNKRQEVERELDSSKKVLVQVAQKCDEASTSASGFLRDTQQVFASLGEAKAKGKGKGGGKGGKAAPASGGGDFNP